MKHHFAVFLALGLVGCQSTSTGPATSGTPSTTQTASVSASGGCNPSVEDFEKWVTGGQECLAIKTFRSKATFSGPPTLVIVVHGDGASGSRADQAPQYWVDQIEDNILGRTEYRNSNTLIAVIARLGYPIQGVGRSSGHRPEPNGRRATYQPRYINPVFAAIDRLIAHYSPKDVVAWGSSGGAATLAIGSGLNPATPINKMLLTVCPCDVPTWEFGHGWPYSAAHSPLDYAAKIPVHTETILVVGTRDKNTSPSLSETFLKSRRAAGGQGRIVYTDGTHSSTRNTPGHVAEQIKTISSSS